TEYALPRAVVVNRLDRERADFSRALESLARRLKGRLVALQIPLGEESNFRGYVDLVRIKAVTYANGKASEGEVPGDLSDRVKEYREKLVEAAAETDDELLSKYLEEGSLGEPEMLRSQVARRHRRWQARASPLRLRRAQPGIGRAARPRRRLAALARRPRRGGGDRPQGEAAGDALARTQGARGRTGVQDALRPPHRQALALPRLQRHAQGRRDAPQRLALRQGAHRARLVAHGQDAEERRGARSRRAR